MWSQLCALDPDEDMSNNHKVKSIIQLAVQFPNLVDEVDLDSLQDQWQQLPSAKNCIGDSNRGLAWSRPKHGSSILEEAAFDKGWHE